MTFERKNGETKVNMTDCVEGMLQDFLAKFHANDEAVSPAAADMFARDHSERSNAEKRELHHKMAAKTLFACKRARPDVQPTVSVLCTQVQGPGQGDWNKSVRTVKCSNGTVEDKLTLSATKGVSHAEWFIDAAFAVHPDFRSHTGGQQ